MCGQTAKASTTTRSRNRKACDEHEPCKCLNRRLRSCRPSDVWLSGLRFAQAQNGRDAAWQKDYLPHVLRRDRQDPAPPSICPHGRSPSRTQVRGLQVGHDNLRGERRPQDPLRYVRSRRHGVRPVPAGGLTRAAHYFVARKASSNLKIRHIRALTAACSLLLVLTSCAGQRPGHHQHVNTESAPPRQFACQSCYDEAVKVRTGPPKHRYYKTIVKHHCKECQADMEVYAQDGRHMIKCGSCGPGGLPCDKCLPPHGVKK